MNFRRQRSIPLGGRYRQVALYFTNWGLTTHSLVRKFIIGLDNVSPPDQMMIFSTEDFLTLVSGNFSSKHWVISCKKIHLKITSSNFRPLHEDFRILTHIPLAKDVVILMLISPAFPLNTIMLIFIIEVDSCLELCMWWDVTYTNDDQFTWHMYVPDCYNGRNLFLCSLLTYLRGKYNTFVWKIIWVDILHQTVAFLASCSPLVPSIIAKYTHVDMIKPKLTSLFGFPSAFAYHYFDFRKFIL